MSGKVANDAEVRTRLARGDREGAFGLLFQGYAGELARYVEFRAPHLSADVCQETWIAVRDALPRFRFECRPGVWLRAIARRKLVDALRGEEWHDTLDSQLAETGLGALAGQSPSTPTSRLRRGDRAAALRAALAKLESAERDLLALRYLDDLKPAEIAHVLGSASANTVSQRLVRLVRRLREELARAPAFAP